MSNNNINKVSEESKAVVYAMVMRELNGLKAEVEVNPANVWVSTREKTASQILKDLGFRWAKSRKAWWRPLAEEWLGSTEPMSAEAIRHFLGAEPKALSAEVAPAVEPKAPEVVAEPTVQEVETMVAEGEKDLAEGKLIALSFDRDWLWVSGEATRKIKSQLVELGFRWSARRKAWYNRNGFAVDGVKLQTLIGIAYA